MGVGLKLSLVNGQDILGEPGTDGAKAATQPPVARTPPTTVPDSPATSGVNGHDGLDPTRYGDWEKNGRCIDF